MNNPAYSIVTFWYTFNKRKKNCRRSLPQAIQQLIGLITNNVLFPCRVREMLISLGCFIVEYELQATRIRPPPHNIIYTQESSEGSVCVADRGKGRRAKFILRVVAKDLLSADAANLLLPELFRYEVIKQL